MGVGAGSRRKHARASALRASLVPRRVQPERRLGVEMRRTLSSLLLILVLGCRSDPASIDQGPVSQGGESGGGGESGETNSAGEGNAGNGGEGTGAGESGGSSGRGGTGNEQGGGAGIGDGGVTTGGSSGSAGSSGSGSVACPSQPPAEGDPCPIPRQRCFYESPPGEFCPDVCAGECGDQYLCAPKASGEGRWVITEPRVPGCGPPDPNCPADIPANYALCPREGLQCRFERVLCQCTPCADSHEPTPQMTPDDPATWFCTEPVEQCPGVLPSAETSCEDSQTSDCSYGACFGCGPFSWHPIAFCDVGVWSETHGDCQP